MLDNKKLIKLRGTMSQLELARQSGVGRLTIRAMEDPKDGNHNLKNVKKIADVFGIETKELLK